MGHEKCSPKCSWWSNFRLGPFGFIFALCLPLFCSNTHLLCMYWTKHVEIISVAKNRSFLGTYMAQLTCFEWKLSHLSPAFCIWRRWRNSRFWAIYFDIRVPNLTCHQRRENKLSSANSIGSFTNFQLLVSCNRPSITNLKTKFFYLIFGFPFSWLKLGNPLDSFLILSTGKIWKFTLLPNLTCHQHRENKLSSANSIGSFTNFQLLVSCNRPSITNPKMKFFYLIFGFPFSWLKLGNPLNSFLVLSTGKIWKVHPVTKLDIPPAQGKQTVLCQQHWQLHQLSASRLLQWPQHPTPQNEVLLPHLWFSLFMAQTWDSFKFISDFIHRKDLKSSPCYQTWHASNTGKTVLCSANSIGSFINFQLLVSCNRPSITSLKMKFFYPIFGFPFSWLKRGNPLNSFLVLPIGKIWKVHPVTKLGIPPTQGKQYCPLPTALAASQLSASRLLQSPQHHKPQNEVLLPHFWVSLFVAQTWEPFEFILILSTGKFESSPCYQTWHASNTRKTNCPLPSALGEKTEKDRCWPGTFLLFLEHVDADLESY